MSTLKKDFFHILAWDTATPFAAVALVRWNNESDDGNVLAQARPPAAPSQSRTLLPLAAGMLAEVGLVPADLDLLAVGLGPGSFTGLRIGLAAAKGIAWALGCPMVGISTLTVLARQAADRREPEEAVLPVIDARHGQVFTAFFTPDYFAPDGRDREAEPQALAPRALVDTAPRPGLLVGPGLELLPPLGTDSGLRRAGDLVAPDPAVLARLAGERYSRAPDPLPPPTPLYVRPPDIWGC